ncbi:hypothetical protein SLEP1_g18980 [Rubroshorea leprosula]|uniref:Uncharacterized protein n=1 Tax=Rubroshorea leprosula TaxID=152421 RepID=A0AAV5J9V6_9ROSI|nr:hypothetical protein SLEP1_g18980 [Rubroshorea leprosula]
MLPEKPSSKDSFDDHYPESTPIGWEDEIHVFCSSSSSSSSRLFPPKLPLSHRLLPPLKTSRRLEISSFLLVQELIWGLESSLST